MGVCKCDANGNKGNLSCKETIFVTSAASADAVAALDLLRCRSARLGAACAVTAELSCGLTDVVGEHMHVFV